jgi:glutaminase
MEKISKSTSISAEDTIVQIYKEQLLAIFETLNPEGNQKIPIQKLLEVLERSGLSINYHYQLQSLGKFLTKKNHSKSTELSFEEFFKLLKSQSSEFIKHALLKNLAVSDFEEFTKDIKQLYKETKGIKEGEVEDEKVKKYYGISVCTVDGQRFNIGDHEEKFVLQSVSKAINYAIALHEVGEQKVHQHVGREPSGRGYNGLFLNEEDLPHNPMINAGAIMVCSLIKPKLSVEKRHQYIIDTWNKICGGDKVNFREDKMSFEGSSHQRNMALSYYMLEKGAFPENTDIYKTIDLYKRCNLIEMNVSQLAVAGATLANGGVCPLTGEPIFNDEDVRDTLSLMLSCGMYDYSGEFAFLVGLPAKSGVSGALMVVIPGLMCISIYSPPIDDMGNSVRGVKFFHELVKKYGFHKYDHIVNSNEGKKDPKKPRLYQEIENHCMWYYAASFGLIKELQNLLGRGVDINCVNPDQRTALHVAASEGKTEVVEYLLSKGANPKVKDRWDQTPLENAKYGKHQKIINLLEDVS